MHRVSVEPFLTKWAARAQDKARLSEHFDVTLLGKCVSCQACKDDCPVCKIDPSYQPTEIIEQLLRGEIDEVLAEGKLWKCLECYTCTELCPSDIGMAETFRTLKELAIASGNGPASVKESYETVLKEGTLGKPRESARRKLGLAPLPASGGDALLRLLSADGAGEKGAAAQLASDSGCASDDEGDE